MEDVNVCNVRRVLADGRENAAGDRSSTRCTASRRRKGAHTRTHDSRRSAFFVYAALEQGNSRGKAACGGCPDFTHPLGSPRSPGSPRRTRHGTRFRQETTHSGGGYGVAAHCTWRSARQCLRARRCEGADPHPLLVLPPMDRRVGQRHRPGLSSSAAHLIQLAEPFVRTWARASSHATLQRPLPGLEYPRTGDYRSGGKAIEDPTS